MDNSFQLKKWRAIFKKLDTDGDGVYTMKDITELCEKVATKAERPLNEPSHSIVSQADMLKKPWVQMFHVMSGGKEKMTFEQFRAEFLKIDAMEGRMNLMTDLSKEMFNALDMNGDGMVTKDEYKIWMTSLGVSDEDWEYGFDMIDADKDGLLSIKEFGNARAKYYFDKEDTVYKHFYGKFKDDLVVY
jgi:Ca2+-binding EF-hand superfamily protein